MGPSDTYARDRADRPPTASTSMKKVAPGGSCHNAARRLECLANAWTYDLSGKFYRRAGSRAGPRASRARRELRGLVVSRLSAAELFAQGVIPGVRDLADGVEKILELLVVEA